MRSSRQPIAAGLALILGLASAEGATRGPANRPPDVVLIIADDLGWGDVGFNGRKEWATPNLDGLAAGGTTFRRIDTAAVVCAPSRAAMLTGKATIHRGVCRNAGKVDGLDVLPACLGRGRVPERTLFWEWRSEGANQVAAMRGRFKRVVVDGGPPELFDVEADASERRYAIAEHPKLSGKLRSELKAWLATEVRD